MHSPLVSQAGFLTMPIDERWFSEFRSFKDSAFRLEVLQAYAEPSEADVLAKFNKNEPVPEEWIADWCALVRNHVQSGHVMQRVHLVDIPLSNYMHFEFQCAYKHTSVAGEDIRVLNRSAVPGQLLDALKEDFWLFDESKVMVQDYNEAGTLKQARITTDPLKVSRYLQIRDEVLKLSVPFDTFYNSLSDPPRSF